MNMKDTRGPQLLFEASSYGVQSKEELVTKEYSLGGSVLIDR